MSKYFFFFFFLNNNILRLLTIINMIIDDALCIWNNINYKVKGFIKI